MLGVAGTISAARVQLPVRSRTPPRRYRKSAGRTRKEVNIARFTEEAAEQAGRGEMMTTVRRFKPAR